MYFKITSDEDGVDIKAMSREDLLEELEEYAEDGGGPKMLGEIPDRDPMYWGDYSMLIIKGEIVTPKPVTTVTKYTID